MALSYPSKVAFEYDYERRPSFARRFRRSIRRFYKSVKSTVILMAVSAGISLAILHGGGWYIDLCNDGVNNSYDRALRERGITPTRDHRERDEIQRKADALKVYREVKAAEEVISEEKEASK